MSNANKTSQKRTPCEFWDCGWCYAPKELSPDDTCGQCLNHSTCKAWQSRDERVEDVQ